MNLILLTQGDLEADSRATLSDHRAEHIRAILKAKAGDSIHVGRVNGPSATATIASMSETEIILDIETWNEPEPVQPTVDIIMALPRPQILRRVLRTCGMMAVRRLDLIRANRVEKSYFDSPLLEPSAYTKYLLEGMSQGEYTRLPEVEFHDRFKPFWEDTIPSRDYTNAIRLLAHNETSTNLLSLSISRNGHIVAAIGPEGGWVPFEVETMMNAHFQIINLGPWNLRVDAALVAALAQIELQVSSTCD